MKRAMIAAMGAVLVVAGVASASVFSSGPETPKRVTALQAQPQRQPPPTVTSTAAPVAVTKISTSTHPEMQRPPVPLRHAPRPPVPVKEDKSITTVADKAGDKASEKTGDKAVDTANAPATEDQEGARLAKSAIERDGYKNVKVVSKAADGSWRGRARRGQTEVGVTVDASGNVRVD